MNVTEINLFRLQVSEKQLILYSIRYNLVINTICFIVFWFHRSTRDKPRVSFVYIIFQAHMFIIASFIQPPTLLRQNPRCAEQRLWLTACQHGLHDKTYLWLTETDHVTVYMIIHISGFPRTHACASGNVICQQIIVIACQVVATVMCKKLKIYFVIG